MFGKPVLDTVHAFSGQQNAAILIRHGERHAFTPGSTDPTEALLTDKGMQMAKDMGAALQRFDHVRLFHSPVKRCRQTAQCFAEGVASKGVTTEIIGEHPCLGFGYTRDMATAISMYAALNEAFVGEWFSGKVPDSIIAAPELVASETMAHVAGRLQESSKRGRRLDVHVSHDWNILVLRELLLGVTHEKAGWLTFLDGVSFSNQGIGAVSAHYREAKAQQTLPWKQFVLRPRQA